MFDLLIRFSIRNRFFVLILAALLLSWGGWLAVQLPVDVFPDLNRPTVSVMTEAGGMSPEEVEILVSRPIETAMNGAPGVERVRSQSAPGLSIVWVEFGWDVDIYRARQQVSERISEVTGELDGLSPRLAPVSSIMGEILLVGLSSEEAEITGMKLRSLAETMVRPRLLALPGLSQVTAMGGGLEELQVEVDPTALARFGLDLAAVRAATAGAQGSSSGGFLERKSQEYLVRNLARTADPLQIGATVVAMREGVPIRLDQVATVARGRGLMRGDAGVNGKAAVILSIQKQPGADTLGLTTAVEKALAELGPALGKGVEVTPLFRQADFITAAINNVEEALGEGVILVVLILLIFLLNLRTTAITLTAIPLSFVVSALVLKSMGMSVNTMTLGGLAVAIGELVDDAIVDVENVTRRLRENACLQQPRPIAQVVFEASREVRNSIVYSTLLVALVFVPLFSLSGIEGRLFAPLGVAYITAILASMAVSLTVTPALCCWLFGGPFPKKMEMDGVLVRHLKRLDRKLLSFFLPRPRLVIQTTLLLVGLAAASVPLLGSSFLPSFYEGTATLSLQAAPGTSLGESNRLGRLAELQLLQIPEVASVGRRTGRAEQDEHAEGVHSTEIDVDFKPDGRPRTEVLAEIRQRLGSLPGLSLTVGQPISHRLDHLLSGVRAAIAVKLFGTELGGLREAAGRIALAMRPIPGMVDVSVEPQVLVPQLQVEVRREEALRYGIQPGLLSAELGAALGGSHVGQVLDGVRRLDLVVRYAAHWREDPSLLAVTPIVLPDGRAVPIGNVAELRLGSGPNQIFHENAQRRVVVSANTADRDVGSVVQELREVLKNVDLPEGSWIHIDGSFESQQAASRRIGLLSLLSLAGMYTLLYAHFRSHVLTLQVLLNLPLALVGAVAAIWISGQPLSVATLVGFITLCGIASRNTILMISHYLHLAAEEGEPFGPELVIRGSLERLVPVLMTALCAGLGLVPLALAGGEAGKEILAPVAQVILGGLISSTLLDLFVTPTIFYHYGRAALEATLKRRPDLVAEPAL